MTDDAALSPDERAELERLRAEVAELRSQAPTAAAVATDQPVVPPSRPRKQRWRSVVATLLIVIGCILAPISVVAVWTKNLVTDTDQYVATVAPLASDPAIQSAIADKITAEVFTHLDVVGITNQAVDALAERGLPPLVATQLHALSQPLSSGVQSFVRDQVGEVVASDAFVNAWSTANRAAHEALVAALTGETREGVTIENDTVSINLGPIIQEVKQRLIDRGFELASRIPNVNPSFVLVQSDYIAQARGAFNLLNAIGNWLPVIALFFLAIGIYVAKGHRRALVGVGLGLAGGMLALGLALALFRTIYLNELPLGVLTRDAAAVFLRHPRTVPAAGPTYGAGPWTRYRSGRVPYRPLRHRGPGSGGPDQGYWLAARRCRTGWLPHWPGWRLGLHVQEGVVGRCDCDSSAGVGLLGSADRESGPRHNPGSLGRARDHRVPW